MAAPLRRRAERVERERDGREDRHRGGRQPGRVQQHQGEQEREPGARPGGVLIGGDLAPEAVHDLDGDTRQQEQARGAIGFGRPDRRHEGDRRQQSGEARQGRRPDGCESAGGHAGRFVPGVAGDPIGRGASGTDPGRGLPTSSPSANPVGGLEAPCRPPAPVPASSFPSR